MDCEDGYQDLTFNITNADGDELTLRTPWDTGIEDVIHLFRTIAFWLTWSPEQINQVIPEPDREWSYDDERDTKEPGTILEGDEDGRI